MKIISVVGARPNFMKIAPFIRAIEKHNTTNKSIIEHILVHTGQHYDDRMSHSFFADLGIPEADLNLGIGSGTHAEQVGKTMIEFEKVLHNINPDWVVVVGDVNAILACSVTAKKERIKCCHIEAGLRSGDMTMPEEINRLVADRISDLLLTPDRIASENLKNEGVSEGRIRFVGNIMIDTLDRNLEKAKAISVDKIIKANLISGNPDTFKNAAGDFAVMTLHRPSNVDEKSVLEPIVDFILTEICTDRLLLWSVHPRTRKMLEKFGLYERLVEKSNLILLEPLGYLEMLKLNSIATIILTDSGGLQEESTVLGTPCLTLRWNTERPVTLLGHGGVSVLTGNSVDNIRREYRAAIERGRRPIRPELWDGKTAERCLESIISFNE